MSFINKKNKNNFKTITKSGKELRQNIVFKQNELSQKYILNLSNKDSLFLNFLISLIEPPKNPDGSDLLDENGNIREQFTQYCFHKKLYFDCIGIINKGDNIKNFEESILKMNSISYFLKEKNEVNGHKIKRLVKIIDKCQIDETNGYIYIKFDESCFKFLFNINNHNILNNTNETYKLTEKYGGFNAHELIDEILFKSKYSRPIFEYLLSFKGFETKTILVDDIKSVCGIKKTQYQLYKSFKQRVLNEALKEINKYTNFNIIILEEIKENYYYPIKIKFSIKQKDVYKYNERINWINNILDNKKEEKDKSKFYKMPDYMEV